MFENFLPGRKAMRLAEAEREHAIKIAPSFIDEVTAPQVFHEEIPSMIEDVSSIITKTHEEKLLSKNECIRSKKLKGSANDVFLVSLDNAGSAIFKPSSGERVTIEGSGYKRECAAYFVDRFFGINLVPPTVLREINGEIGSLQRFIVGARTGYERREDENYSAYSEEEMIRMRIFDYIISNNDRGGANYIVKNKRLYAIDHGLAFQTRIYGCDNLFFYMGKRVPEDILVRTKKLLTSEKLTGLFTAELSKYMEEQEVWGVMGRLDNLLNAFSQEPVLNREKIIGLRRYRTV